MNRNMCVLFSLLLPALVHSGGYVSGARPAHVAKALEDKEKYTGSGATPAYALSLDELPQEFDWCRRNGRSFCTISWNQHIPSYCGSCWLHGTLASIQDRIKVAKDAQGAEVELCRQDILNCGSNYGFGNGCDGGEAQDVYEYMHRFGLPDATCNNYVAKSNQCNMEGRCMNCMPFLPGGKEGDPKVCWPVANFTRYWVTEYGNVKGEAQMMSEIQARGPITCGIAVTPEFSFNYFGGVYKDTTGNMESNHDVEVVGWGVDESGEKYWRVRNSWGTYWGENGFFRIVRGTNNLAIENDCSFAIVDHSEENLIDNRQVRGSMFGLTSPAEVPAGNPEQQYYTKKAAEQREEQAEEQAEAEQAGEQAGAQAEVEVEAVEGAPAEPEVAAALPVNASQTQTDVASHWLLFSILIVVAGYFAYKWYVNKEEEYHILA